MVLKEITNYKTQSPSTVENQQLAGDLNEFYCRFEKTLHTHPEHLFTQPLTSPPHLQFRSAKTRCNRSSRSRKGKSTRLRLCYTSLSEILCWPAAPHLHSHCNLKKALWHFAVKMWLLTCSERTQARLTNGLEILMSSFHLERDRCLERKHNQMWQSFNDSITQSADELIFIHYRLNQTISKLLHKYINLFTAAFT